MNVSKTTKTVRVLLLYLTVPLFVITMVLIAVALMSATKKKSAPMPEVSVPMDAGASPGSAEPPKSVRLDRPSIQIEAPEAKEEKPADTTAGQTAIITAIMTGITGLVGAIVQVVMAFLKAQQRRKNEPEA